jgi:hypothetical protein
MYHPGLRARTGVCGPAGPYPELGRSGIASSLQAGCDTYGPTGACRLYYIGFDSEPLAAGGIAAGAALDIPAEPQEQFVGLELIVPSTLAPFFNINSITVGRIPQAIAAGAVGATVFSEVSFRAHLELDPANRGTNITINVTNTDAVARRFTAALIGKSVFSS